MRYLSFLIFVLLILTACTESNRVCEDCVDIVSDATITDTYVEDTQNPIDEFSPFMPEKPKNPYVDRAYIEEYNSNPAIYDQNPQELVSVIDTSGSLVFDNPTKVSKRGFYLTRNGKEELFEIDGIKEDIRWAGYLQNRILLVGEHSIFIINEALEISEQQSFEDLRFSGLYKGKHLIYLLTNKGIGFFNGQYLTLPDPKSEVDVNLVAAYENETNLFVGGGNKIYVIDEPVLSGFEYQYSISLPQDAGDITAIVGDITLIEENPDLIIIGSSKNLAIKLDIKNKGYQMLDTEIFAQNRVPLSNPRMAIRMWDGGFAVSTDGGVYRLVNRDGFLEWRVYNYERWVASEDVRWLLCDAETPLSNLYIATAKGLSTVTFKKETLEQKLSLFVKRIMERHDRDGAVADSHLTKRGDLSSNIPWDSDNDGSWTSYWLLAECFRYKVTNDKQAKENFDRSLEAMLRLRDVTGTDYFVARSVIRKEGCRLDDCDNPDDGYWYTSPDGKWWVKRDTSNDEVIAHIFMMGHAYDLCADENQKKRIREHIAGIVGGIIDHGYQLIDPVTGKVTTYGQFDPKYVNENPSGEFGDGGVRSAEIIAGLDLAYYMTRDERFMNAKKELMQKYHYDDNIENTWDHPFHKGNSDGDEMGTEAFFVLLRYEQDTKLRDRWYKGWRKTYENTLKYHQGAWWDMVNAVVGAPDYNIEVVARWLRLAPVDMIRWNMHNSHRKDIVPPPIDYYKDAAIRSDGYIIPYNERRCDRWNTDQFRIDGGMNGEIEMDAADVLAPYWMARYYGFITTE